MELSYAQRGEGLKEKNSPKSTPQEDFASSLVLIMITSANIFDTCLHIHFKLIKVHVLFPLANRSGLIH